MLTAFALMLAGATTVVRVDVAEDLSIESAHEIATQLAAEIERNSGGTVVPETRPTGKCTAEEAACVRDIRARMKAEQVVLIRLYRAISTIGLFAQVAGTGRSAKAELEVGPASWPKTLRSLAAELYPPKKSAPKSEVVAAPPARVQTVERPFPYWGPVISLGLAGVLASASITLWVAALDRKAEIDRQLEAASLDGTIYGITFEESELRYDDVDREGYKALGVGIGAGALLITGIVWWLLID